ncbi:carbohydrate ABC transporter permease [Mycobacterium sp. KBS0706]|uniref:carbohydrate ABC transporter permease n=1 Tax=Mycobacterium sp. KBS0706 TaxID=2578109 RepID=UPI00110FEC78|nr:carbohydrate ABC transporter permease [Mycobacterium sp. KBS0706]TSD85198.1 carbohydrate ABC transporter permease [Mycobacterium sp. KBS0706]
MAIQRSARQAVGVTILGWAVGLILFFPIGWMVLTSFKTEIDAFTTPPSIFFTPTLENYAAVNSRIDYFSYALNSVYISFGSTLLCLVIGGMAAYSMAFFPTKRTEGTLLWMLSTKMMPAVGVLVPMYMGFRDLGLLNSVVGMVLLMTLVNLPIVVWMLYTYFRDYPREILEAARVDGATSWQEMLYILLPTTLPGIVSTSLLTIILAWNEAFWSINLTGPDSGPLTAFIASFSSPEGLFWAKLSAASTLAIAPILVLGWLSQRQLVRGLTFGAVK